MQTIDVLVKFDEIQKKVVAKQELTDEEATFYRDELLMDWEKKKAALEVAKEVELLARTKAVEFMRDPAKAGTTENVELGNGYKAKMKTPINYGFVKKEDGGINKPLIDKALQRIEKTGPVGELVAERLIKWAPSLSLTEYKQLDEKFKKIIDEVITTSEGTPTLEIVEPKAKK